MQNLHTAKQAHLQVGTGKASRPTRWPRLCPQPPPPPVTREDANQLETHAERNMFSGKPSPLGEVSFPGRRSTARCLKPPQGNGPGRSRLDDLYPHGLFDRGDVFGCYNRGGGQVPPPPSEQRSKMLLNIPNAGDSPTPTPSPREE